MTGPSNRGQGPGDEEVDELWEEFVETDPSAGTRSASASSEFVDATADLDDERDHLTDLNATMTLAGVEEELNKRWPETKIAPSLTRINALLDLLGNPQNAYSSIHIAGTNGKTSTARMVDSLLSRIGVRTGRFTSPHLQSVTERISIDGAPISDDEYVRAYLEVLPYVDLVDASSARSGGVPLSKFEILTAMAYAVFANTPVDVAVIEVGLGGRWDSTNVINAAVNVITPIGMDHTDYLGDTLTAIAGEKAGIIKRDSVVVLSPQQAEAMTVLMRTAVNLDATVARYGSEFAVTERQVAVGGQRLTIQGLGGVYDEIFLPLHGPHQAENAALALAAVEAFFGAGRERQLDIAAIRDGFAEAASPGRLERLGGSPMLLVDAAHNPHGAAALARAIADEFAFTHLVGVLAVMADKDVSGLFEALADTLDQVVVTRNSSPRSMDVDELADVANAVFGAEKVHTADDLESAVALARELAAAAASDATSDSGAEPEGRASSGVGVLATGSVVTAGDVRQLVGRTPQ